MPRHDRIYGEKFKARPHGWELDPSAEKHHAFWAWVWFTFACVILAAWFVLLFVGGVPLKGIGVLALATLLYLILGYCVKFEPDYRSDDGWAGGLINKPFDFSDNINRFRISLHFLFAPGRFLAESLIGPLRLGHEDQQRDARAEARRKDRELNRQIGLFLQVPSEKVEEHQPPKAL
jgi:hypothetical protein